MSKFDNFKGKAGTNGFDKNPQNRNNNGRSSIKAAIRKYLASDGRIKIPSDQVLQINDDGSVVIEMPNADKAAMKVIQWAMSSKTKGADVLMRLMEHVDGKAPQSITLNDPIPDDLSGRTTEELEQVKAALLRELDE